MSAALISGEAGAAASPEAAAPGIAKIQAVQGYGQLPLAFVENQGQVDSQVKYFTRGRSHSVFFTPKGMTLGLSRAVGKGKDRSSAVVQLRPLGMHSGVEIAAGEPLEGKTNYYRGNDPSKWVTGVSTYKTVVYREAYAGIDLKFYGNGQEMEYDLIVKPGADPKQVKFLYEGIKGMKVSKSGELIITLPDGGQLVQKNPVIYQEIDGQRISREGKFRILPGTKNRGYGFELASYDARYPLVIDPVVLAYSTYLGGSVLDTGNAIVVDVTGSAYVVGTTSSPNFPHSTGAFIGGEDVFITKFNPVGNALVYSIFLGGTGNDEGMAIALDAANNVYVTGLTGSANFPTTINPAQSGLAGATNAFFTKFDVNGGMVYSSFLGGNGSDMGKAIAVDAAGDAYLGGDTSSTNFPHSATAMQTTLLAVGSSSCFVSKIHPAGTGITDLVYSTYMTGSVFDSLWGLVVDSLGQAWVTGETESTNFPHTVGGLTGFSNVFFSKLNATGSALVFGTIFGSTAASGTDMPTGGIARDAADNAYITGNTDSNTFPTTPGAFQTILKGFNNAFVTKFDASNTMVYSSFLGGSGTDMAWFTAVDGFGNLYITGDTSSADFPIFRGYLPLKQFPATSNTCGFVTKFKGSALNTLIYSTFLGGNTTDFGFGVAVDAKQFVYVTGQTLSTNFPVKGAFQAAIDPLNTLGTAFVTKLTTGAQDGVDLLLLLN